MPRIKNQPKQGKNIEIENSTNNETAPASSSQENIQIQPMFQQELQRTQQRFLFNIEQIQQKYCKSSSGVVLNLSKDKFEFDPELCSAENDEELIEMLNKQKQCLKGPLGDSQLSTPAMDLEQKDGKQIKQWEQLNETFENNYQQWLKNKATQEKEEIDGKQPTNIAKVAEAIPMPLKTNMDSHNTTNTSPTPSTTTNKEDKHNDGDGVKAPTKRGRQSSNEKSTPLAEEMFVSPPQKKSAIIEMQKQPEAVKKQPMNELMQDLAKTMENYDQFKKKMKRIQKHDTNNFMVNNDFAEKMKEFCEKACELNALVPESVHIQPIRKRIKLTINNCRELFTKDEFRVTSTAIELFGFKWFLVAKMKEKGFMALYLYAVPPSGFKGNYRIEVDYRFSILNTLADKDLIEEHIGRVYTLDEKYPSGYGWGYSDMAKFEDLLDPNKTFLTRDGNIEVWVDFTIKSSTLNHLT